MLTWLIRALRFFDIRLIYLFAAVFVVPVCLILNPSYGISYRLFRLRFGQKPLRAMWNTYVNHVLFSQVVIDRFAMYAGKKFKFVIEGEDYFWEAARKQPGFIQLSSHIGNYELAGYSLKAKEKVFNALVFGGEKVTVMENRNKMFADTNIRMIAIKDDMSHIFAINNALENGEIMSIPADRIFGSEKCIRKQFLGAEAKFPFGPFAIATMRGLDVLAVNVMKISTREYKIHVTPLNYDKKANRKQQIDQLSTAYVKELERMLKLYPTQWYNYFEFWNQ
nr:lysophospholipid acyltransferase family protein [Prevotella sp.]